MPSKPHVAVAQWRSVLRLLRPRQMLKNGFVLMPLVFSGLVVQWPSVLEAAVCFLAFAACSIAVYCLNDVLDAEADRQHPKKRYRPVASGAVSSRNALLIGSLFALLGLSTAFALGWLTGTVLGVYLVLNIAYCVHLKHVPLLDVMSIAFGFLLRVVGGSTAIFVWPSRWLLICTTFLALLLALVKRRQEVVSLAINTGTTRKVLSHYPLPLLDQLIAGLVPTTLLSYMLYAYQIQQPAFLATSAFVAYGLFRYLYLIHTQEAGEQPEDVLLKDPATLVNVLAWIITCGVCLLMPIAKE